MKIYSVLLVTFQIILISLLGLSSELNGTNYIYLIIIFLGALLGVWAFWLFRSSKFRITPDVADGAKLITNGPYKYIRHPMYSAVLVICLGLILSNINVLSLVFYALLLIDLIFKINYEEKSLVSSFSEYKQYMKKTKRIIPFII